MRIKTLGCILVTIFLLAGCAGNKTRELEVPKPSSEPTAASVSASSTSQTEELIQNHVYPYGLQAPNDIYNHLIVTGSMKVIDATKGTETRGRDYLYNNGYSSVSETNTTNPNSSYVPEDSSVLPNGRNAYGRLIYFYFWCNDEMKNTLAQVTEDGDFLFYDATEEYLDTLNQLLTPSESSDTLQAQVDLDIEAINNGDISSLTGTWINGAGDSLVINADGTTNTSYTIYSVKDSDKTSKIPYTNLSDGMTGAALGLYKIGFKNPDGDYSDTTKPRLTIAQQGGAYPPEAYYYRQQ